MARRRPRSDGTVNYSCSSGTLSGSNCQITDYGTVTYTCSQGTLNFSRAGALCLITTTETATPTLECPADHTLAEGVSAADAEQPEPEPEPVVAITVWVPKTVMLLCLSSRDLGEVPLVAFGEVAVVVEAPFEC